MHVDVRKVLYRVQEYFWRTALLPVIDFPRGRNLVRRSKLRRYVSQKKNLNIFGADLYFIWINLRNYSRGILLVIIRMKLF